MVLESGLELSELQPMGLNSYEVEEVAQSVASIDKSDLSTTKQKIIASIETSLGRDEHETEILVEWLVWIDVRLEGIDTGMFGVWFRTKRRFKYLTQYDR